MACRPESEREADCDEDPPSLYLVCSLKSPTALKLGDGAYRVHL